MWVTAPHRVTAGGWEGWGWYLPRYLKDVVSDRVAGPHGPVQRVHPKCPHTESDKGYTLRDMTSWSYSNAGLPTDPLQIDTVTITPDPPRPGGEVKLTIKGTVQEAIEDGAYFDVTVKLGLIKLLQKQFDFFQELRDGSPTEGWSASPDPAGGPIKPGDLELTVTMQLPREVPQAKFNLAARGYTAADDDLAALDLRFDFMRHGAF